MRGLVATVLLVVLACVSFARNEYWRNDGTIWQDVIARYPGKARAYNELGLYYLVAGNNTEAYMLLTKSLELNPYQPEIIINLGIAYERLNMIDKAVETYERAIAIKPDEPTAYYNLGTLYYNTLHDREKALSFLLKARDLNPLEPDVHLYLALIYRDQGAISQSNQEMDRFRYLKQ